MRYINTSASELLGARADSTGHSYFRLVFSMGGGVLASLGVTLGFAQAAGLIYTTIQESGWVVPVSPPPVDDTLGATAIDVSVIPPGRSVTVGDLVALTTNSYTVRQLASLYSIERVTRDDVNSTNGPAQRQAAAEAAARDHDENHTLSSLFPSLPEVGAYVALLVLLAVGLLVAYLVITRRK